ncbi:MAG: Rpp14/Pop5 family protein [Candidatus Nanohaloarchaea archaeon]
MIPIKRLPPAIQEEHRYLEFQVHCESQVELGDVVNAVWDAALGFDGSRGASEMDFWIIGNRFSEKDQRGIVKVNRHSEEELRAALALIDSLGGEKGLIEVTQVSGTLESLAS